MTGLEKIDKQIYDTYHDPKNKDVLPIFIFFGIIVLIFKSAILWELIVWGIYYSYCSSNNEKLNNNPKNLENREYLLDYRKRLLNGEIKFKN